MRWLILQLYNALSDWPHSSVVGRYAIGRGFDPVVVL